MKTIYALALIGLSIALTVKILSDLDINRVVYNHTPGVCRYVEGIDTAGSEDLILLPNGLALISSGVFMPISPNPQPGKIYIFDPSKQGSSAETLAIKGDESWKPDEFYPLGITAWEQGGEITVYVINSFSQKIHVFQLDISKKQLVLSKSLQHLSISNPNNLVAIGKDKFFVSNFIYYSNLAGVVLELTQKLPFGAVWYHDGSSFVQVVNGLKGPNGITLSNSRKFLYLAAHLEKAIRVYRVDPSNFTSLTLVNKIDLHTGVDNLNVDSQGALWVGSHPIGYKVALHLFDHKKYPSPSQVLKIVFNEDHTKFQVEEVYADDGSSFSGSTVAALTPDGRHLLIGSIMEKTLICQI